MRNIVRICIEKTVGKKKVECTDHVFMILVLLGGLHTGCFGISVLINDNFIAQVYDLMGMEPIWRSSPGFHFEL